MAGTPRESACYTMKMRLIAPLLLVALVQDPDVERWGKSRVRPVVADAAAHTIHSYYVTTPESPDGRRVLYYASTGKQGYEGEVRILERASGAVKTLASKVTVEDAHRTACQQWVSRGKRVVYHDFRGGEWVVVCVTVDSGEERVLAKGRQVGFGAPGGDVVPIYG